MSYLIRTGNSRNNVLWANLQIDNADTLNYLQNLFQKSYGWHWCGNEDITCYVNTSGRTITWGGPNWGWTTSTRAEYLGPILLKER